MNDTPFDYLQTRLAALQQSHSFRQLVPRAVQGVRLTDDRGQQLWHFGSNDYLGLGCRQATSQALPAIQAGAGASALVAGHSMLHQQLCHELADWEQTEAAVLFPSGYAACSGTVATLAEAGDLLLSDELNHASLIDGCRLSKATRMVYRHLDLDHVEQLLKAHRTHSARCWIITESVFGMDGDVAPLDKLCDLAERYDAQLIVDEAHGTGILGPDRSGGCAHFSVKSRVAIRIGTLSKAIGSHGGFVVGPRVVIDYLINRCRSLIFSTAGSPLTIAAAIQSVRTIRQSDSLTRLLHANSLSLRQQLQANFAARLRPTAVPEVPIIPLVIGSNEAAMQLSRQLEQAGFFVPAIRPPTVPEGTARLRISLTAAHDADLLKHLSDTLWTLLGDA